MQINHAIRLTIETCELKHLSLNTQKTYTHWLRRYGVFLQNHKPSDPATTELKMEAFLTHLATTQIAASTQNQAFNALLFFYRDVLKQNSDPSPHSAPGGQSPCAIAPHRPKSFNCSQRSPTRTIIPHD